MDPAHSLAKRVLSELTAGRLVRLVARGNGTVTTQRALHQVRLALSVTLGKAGAERALQAVTVETFRGEPVRFPDGPFYVHHVDRRECWDGGGKGAVFHYLGAVT